MTIVNKINFNKEKNKMNYQKSIELIKNNRPDKEAIKYLLTTNTEEAEKLFAAANQVRQEKLGDEVHLRGLIEFSSYCNNDCLYCGLRVSNINQERYRLSYEEILSAGEIAYNFGYRTLVLQAGEDLFFDGDYLGKIIRDIKSKFTDIAITISAGIRTRETYEKWFAAGADRYLMRHETADEILFSKLRPGTTLAERLNNLLILRKVGFQIGTGNMVGVPGQTIDTLVEDICLLHRLQPDMVGIGPFIPHNATPLGKYPHGSIDLTLRELAILRILLPYVHLPATTALATLAKDGQLRALNVGANVIMPNVTPSEVRTLYSIYPEKAGSRENSNSTHERIMQLIKMAKRSIAEHRGDSLRIKEEAISK